MMFKDGLASCLFFLLFILVTLPSFAMCGPGEACGGGYECCGDECIPPNKVCCGEGAWYCDSGTQCGQNFNTCVHSCPGILPGEVCCYGEYACPRGHLCGFSAETGYDFCMWPPGSNGFPVEAKDSAGLCGLDRYGLKREYCGNGCMREGSVCCDYYSCGPGATCEPGGNCKAAPRNDFWGGANSSPLMGREADNSCGPHKMECGDGCAPEGYTCCGTHYCDYGFSCAGGKSCNSNAPNTPSSPNADASQEATPLCSSASWETLGAYLGLFLSLVLYLRRRKERV